MNRVELVGRLTKDVETRKTASGLSVANFTVACDRRKSKDAAEGEPTADFIACVVWRQGADYLGDYGRKGDQITVEGRIQTRNYEQDGRRVYVTEVAANEVHLLGGRKNDFDVAREQYEQKEEQQQKTTKSARRNGPPTLNGQAINTEDAFGYDDTLPSIDPERDLQFY